MFARIAGRGGREAGGDPARRETVFEAVRRGDADPKLLAYRYLQMLPQLAQGESNKPWIVPSEFVQTLGRFAGAIGPGSDTEAGPASGDAPESR